MEGAWPASPSRCAIQPLGAGHAALWRPCKMEWWFGAFVCLLCLSVQAAATRKARRWTEMETTPARLKRLRALGCVM